MKNEWAAALELQTQKVLKKKFPQNVNKNFNEERK